MAASLGALGARPAAADSQMESGAGARYYITLGFDDASKAGGAQHLQQVRDALAKQLQKLPEVKLALAEPTKRARARKHEPKGFFVDGSIQRLTASRAGGRQQIECELKGFVATWPERSIKVMLNQSAAVETSSGSAQEAAAKRDCLLAVAGAVGEQIEGFLQTVK